jgi:hypothetical protein
MPAFLPKSSISVHANNSFRYPADWTRNSAIFDFENVCVESSPGSFKYDGKTFFLSNPANLTLNGSFFGVNFDVHDMRYIVLEPLSGHLVDQIANVSLATKQGDLGLVRLMNTSNPRINFVGGVTIMPECFFQGFNPAHLLFGLSLLFEFGLSPPGRFHVAKLDRIAFF